MFGARFIHPDFIFFIVHCLFLFGRQFVVLAVFFDGSPSVFVVLAEADMLKNIPLICACPFVSCVQLYEP